MSDAFTADHREVRLNMPTLKKIVISMAAVVILTAALIAYRVAMYMPELNKRSRVHDAAAIIIRTVASGNADAIQNTGYFESDSIRIKDALSYRHALTEVRRISVVRNGNAESNLLLPEIVSHLAIVHTNKYGDVYFGFRVTDDSVKYVTSGGCFIGETMLLPVHGIRID